jgi:hypothetical protein
MAVDRIHSLTSYPAPPLSDRVRAATGQAAAPDRESRQYESAEARNERSRYRVDDAYRAYTGNHRSPPPRTDSETGETRKISSAELLSSMIHQMGGGVTSSAKGVFVDIAV